MALSMGVFGCQGPDSWKPVQFPTGNVSFEVPDGWTKTGFDDSNWQNATLYEADAVTRAPGYANYADRFGTASFIWSPSLKLDNQVLARFVIKEPENGEEAED